MTTPLSFPAGIPVEVSIAILTAAVTAAIGGLCALALSIQARRELRQTRESFECLLATQRTEWNAEIDRLRSERVEQADVVHPERKQAMQMFRAGIAPDTVASKLGAPKREMRLASEVFKIITAG